jgi:phosphate transport system substrate-binding protein
VWTAGAGKEIAWPTGQGLKGSDGVTAAVRQTEGAIGYSELSFAKSNALPTVKVKNVAGTYVAPDSAEGVTAALAESNVDNDAKVSVNYKPAAANAYPISSFTYVMLPKGNVAADKTKLLQSFVTYAVGDGQKAATPLSYASLPDNVVTKVKSKLAALATGTP